MPAELPVSPTVYLLLNLHCLLGGIAAVIAAQKGRSLTPWLLWGLLGGTATLVIALTLKPQTPDA